MVEVEELNSAEIEELLKSIGYGHLACSHNDIPYVVPVHFAFDDGVIFIYTTEGKKSVIIHENPNVCLEAEMVVDNQNWQSVIVNGVAERLRDETERQHALELITKANPTLSPAVSIRWLDNWVRENIEVVYRITPERTSGRRARAETTDPANVVSGADRSKTSVQ